MEPVEQPPATADVVVVGGGVAGAATAFHAARAGLRPVIVEARAAICTLTTPAAAGAFRLQFDDRDEWDLVRESAELFLNFAEITGQVRYDLGVRQAGYLWLTTDEAGADRQRELVARQQEWGQTDIEVLPGDEARQRFPFVGPNVVQARWRAGDGFLDTKQLTYGLAEGSGGTVVVNCRATGFDIEGGRVTAVRTERGRIAAGAAVIAGGPFSRALAATAGVDLPVECILRQKLIMPNVPQVPADAPMTIDDDTGAHWRPALAGAWLLHTDPATPPSPPMEEVPTDSAFAFRLLDPDSPVAAARTVPFWRDVWDEGAAHWLLQAGQYVVTPDHLPVIGATTVEGLWLNTAYGGHGIMESPAGGARLIDLMTGKADPAANPFRPDRPFVPRDQPTL
ncbi:MAG TPA: FAD-dependent oxidoreductase [Actinomycetota bacterium]|jgi:sarcosine oxidase subunit beta